MEHENSIIEKVKNLGVKDLKNPSPEEIKIILDAYLKGKSLDTELFNNYLNIVNPTLKTLFDGLTKFSEDQLKISIKALDIINQAIDILGKELSRELTIEERSLIRCQIIELVNEARKESGNARDFYKTIAYIGGGVAVIAIGGAVFVLTKGKNVAIIAKGAEMIGKAI